MHKIRPSDIAAKKRYDAKTYDRRIVSLRKQDDADIIAALDALIADGQTTTQAFRTILRRGLNAR